MSRPTVSVVIRSYQEERFIRRLFLGLQNQSFRDFEVILVDSGSTDQTVAIAQAFGARVVLINKAEFSFGRSLNIGCAAAEGDILVFASAHVYPTHTDWLERLTAPFTDPAVMIAYGKQRGNETGKFSERQLFRKWFPEHSDANQGHPFCNNANCAVRRSAWEAVRYDESLTGLEDLAFAKENQRRGGRIAYCADAEIIHVHDETWSQIRNRYRREAIALRRIEPTLRFGLFDFVALSVANIVADLRQAWRQRCLLRECGSVVLFRCNQFWGTYLGYSRHAELTAGLRDRFYFPPRPHGTVAVGRDVSATADSGGLVRIDYDTIENNVR